MENEDLDLLAIVEKNLETDDVEETKSEEEQPIVEETKTDETEELTDEELLAKDIEDVLDDEETEETEPKVDTKIEEQSVIKQTETEKPSTDEASLKQAEAFKTLRLEKEAKEKEIATEKAKAQELENKLALLTKKLSKSMEGFDGDEKKVQKFIDNLVEEQFIEEKGITPEVDKRIRQLEAENEQFKQEKIESQKQQVFNQAAVKMGELLKELNVDGNTFKNALVYYSNLTGVPLFSKEDINIDLFLSAKPQVFKSAVNLYNKKINPQLTVPKQKVAKETTETKEATQDNFRDEIKKLGYLD